MEEPKDFVGEFGRVGSRGKQVGDGWAGADVEEEEEEDGDGEEGEEETPWRGHRHRVGELSAGEKGLCRLLLYSCSHKPPRQQLALVTSKVDDQSVRSVIYPLNIPTV